MEENEKERVRICVCEREKDNKGDKDREGINEKEDSCWGSVGRAVASESRGRWFDSVHCRISISNIH